MPKSPAALPRPELWFLTVRLAELAALALLAGALLEAWTTFQASGQIASDPIDGATAGPAPLMRRLVAVAFYSGMDRAPIGVLVAALLVGAAVAVLACGQRVRHAWLLRWEVLGVGAGAAVVGAGLVTLDVVAMFGENPFGSRDPAVVSGLSGPGPVELGFTALAAPVAAVLVVTASAFWWFQLSADRSSPATVALAGSAPPQGERVPGPTARPDSLALADAEEVEVIEPVDPGARPDEPDHPEWQEGTANGYEEYFRRF